MCENLVSFIFEIMRVFLYTCWYYGIRI